MDGLECCEVFLSEVRYNKDCRIDSSFYTMRLLRNDSLRYEPIGKYLVVSQYGVSKDMNSEGVGYPIFRMNELHLGLCDIFSDKSVVLEREEFEKVCLKDGDVLFNRTNSYEKVGRTGVYYSHGESQTFASYLVRFVPDNINILSEYLTAFLNTRVGIQEVRRRSRHSINQTNVNPEEVKRIPIPVLGKEFQLCIRNNYLLADNYRVSAMKMYAEAETILSKAFDIKVPKKQAPVFSEKSFSKSILATGRLDAEYYQPKYDVLFDSIGKHTCKPLGGDCGLVNISKSIEPGSDAYQDKGIPFVRVSDVSKFGVSDPEVFLNHDIIKNVTSLFPRKDTILFSKDGSVGIAYKVEEDLRIITSGALLHLRVRNTEEILPDYLTLVLNSPVVQLQAERDSNGAIIQHWKPSDIEKVIIPVLVMDIQKEISDKVQESFALRRKAKELLEYAKQAVEMAIEKGEAAALAWLKDRVNV